MNYIADEDQSSPLEGPSDESSALNSSSSFEEEDEVVEEGNQYDNVNDELPDILEFGINAKGTYSCYLEHPELGGKWVASDKIPEIMLVKLDERIEYIKKQLQLALTVQARLLVKYNESHDDDDDNESENIPQSPNEKYCNIPSTSINISKIAKTQFAHLNSEDIDSTQLVLNTMENGDEKKCSIM